MTRTCTVCAHPRRAAIDQALVAGGSLRAIAGQFGLSKSSVERHQAEHLPAALVKAAEAEEVRQALDIIAQLKAINGVSVRTMLDAHNSGERELALKAIDRIHRQIELQAKLLGELDERPQVNLVQSAEWIQVRTQILRALDPFPEAAIAVSQALQC